MELVEGKSLQALLDDGHAFPRRARCASGSDLQRVCSSRMERKRHPPRHQARET